MATENLADYIPRLRLHMGDTDHTGYRYLDEWLRLSLIASVETLNPWWGHKYIFDDYDDVTRNSTVSAAKWVDAQPPVIERRDRRPIILMAGLILKAGDLENMSWNVGAWRDAEIYFSNIEASRGKQKGIQRDWEELTSIIKPPQQRLGKAGKVRLVGWPE